MFRNHSHRVVCAVTLCWMVFSFQSGLATEWETTVAAAKKEGKVVVSLPASAVLRKRVTKAFGKRFDGIELEVVSGRGSKAVRRIADEHQAGVHYFDIHVGGTSSMVTGLVQAGLAEPLAPYMILPEVKDAKNWWGGHIYADKQKSVAYTFQAYMTQTVWYNKNLVKPDEVPSFDNLLDAKWKGKIGILDPRKPGSGSSTWSYLWQIKGKEYLERLVAQDLKVIPNQRVLAEALARGGLAMTIGVSFYTYRPFIEAGQPVEPLPFFKEGTYISGGSGSLTVIKDRAHPEAAKVFVNWLLSKEGQEVFSRAIGQATRRFDVDTSWVNTQGLRAAKDFLQPEDYYKYENQSEEQIETVRVPGMKVARQLLR